MVGFMGKQKSLQSVRESTDSRTDNLCSWLRADAEGAVVSVHARPGAKKNAIVGIFDGKLKIALAAPPVDGKANAKLCEFFAKELGISKSAVRILSGEACREKRIRLSGLSSKQVLEKINFVPD